ncbi:hypothetical protein, partial [Burkholderia vietnamiensis]|uniref:hypothetical protein n=1 Tax=Burkholderia vietnamiensis TaxID=60552 RepID=UPI001ABB50CD
MSDQKRQNMHERYEYPFPDRPQTVPTGARRTGMGPCQGERGFLETVSKRPRGAVNFRGELLTSGIGTTETEEMAKPIIDDELWT